VRRQINERNILFLDEDNACLSQMAEAMAKHLSPPKVRIYSAGNKPGTVSLPVQKVMQELGIKMVGQRAKSIDQIPMQDIDLVVSFADADKHCPDLPKRAKIERWAMSLAAQTKAGDAPLADLRRRRDEIDKRVWALFMDYWRNVV
jgi:arsenate reductase (thioredoxin)